MDGSDFYYGNLQQRLAECGVRMLVICGDASGGKWVRFAKGHLATSGLCRAPELGLVSPLAPLWMAGRQLLSCLRLRRRQGGLPHPLTRRISRLASLECLSQESALTGLLYWIAHAAVRTWRPHAFVTFYEGHAWEKCMWRGAKRADPACQTVGYQHAPIPREALSMLVPAELGPWSTPDVVLCQGEISRGLMRPGHARYRTRMVRFGSFRYHAAGVDQPANPARRTVLVTPEGVISEVKALFSFVFVCAQRLPAYTFLLRCHPQVPMARALRLVSVDMTRQPNVILSDHGRIEDDFTCASVLLYQGTSAAIYAVAHGLLPIYLHREGAVDRDPLYLLEAWRRRCTSPDEFVTLLERHEQASPERLAGEWEQAIRYVNSSTGPVSQEGIREFLGSVGLDPDGDA
jgi:hypothetical protein